MVVLLFKVVGMPPRPLSLAQKSNKTNLFLSLSLICYQLCVSACVDIPFLLLIIIITSFYKSALSTI